MKRPVLPSSDSTSTTKTVSIGDLPILLKLANSLRIAPSTPVSRFLSETPTDHVSEIEIRLGERLEPRGDVLFESGGVWRLVSDGYELTFEFSINGKLYKVATFDRKMRHGVATIDRSVTGPSPDPLEYPFDELVVNHLLARHGGIEVHALGLVEEGRGLLFVGHSGAGKSTIGTLWHSSRPEAVVLSDDRIIIRETADQLRIWGTPWHGEAHVCEAADAPLERIFILRQGPETVARRLSPTAAAAELLSRSFYPVYDRDAIEQTMSFIDGLVADIPVFELTFRKDEDVVATALSC